MFADAESLAMLNIPSREAIVVGEERVFKIGRMQDVGGLLQDKTAEREGHEAKSQKRLWERETVKSDLELSQFPHLENRNKQAATSGDCCKG